MLPTFELGPPAKVCPWRLAGILPACDNLVCKGACQLGEESTEELGVCWFVFLCKQNTFLERKVEMPFGKRYMQSFASEVWYPET